MYPKEFFDTFWRPNIRETAFVAMSFDDSFTSNWTKVIKPAIAKTGLKPHRVDATTISGNIMIEIMDGVAHSRLIIADLTRGKFGSPNANVMYEVGLAHALRDSAEVLIICADRNKLPFDVTQIHILDYNMNDVRASRRKIKEAILHSLSEIQIRKNLKLQLTIEKLDDKCLRLLRNEAKKEAFGTLALAVLKKWFEVDPNKDQLSPDQKREAFLAQQYDEAAVTRLLDLGIIKFESHKQAREMSIYRWTDFGRHILVELGFRSSAAKVIWKYKDN